MEDFNFEKKIKEYIDKQVENKALASKGYVKSEIAELKRNEIEVMHKQIKKLFSKMDLINKNLEYFEDNINEEKEKPKEFILDIGDIGLTIRKYFPGFSGTIEINMIEGFIKDIIRVAK